MPSCLTSSPVSTNFMSARTTDSSRQISGRIFHSIFQTAPSRSCSWRVISESILILALSVLLTVTTFSVSAGLRLCGMVEEPT